MQLVSPFLATDQSMLDVTISPQRSLPFFTNVNNHSDWTPINGEVCFFTGVGEK